MSRLFVVSNRLPALGKGVAAGGLAVALEAALKNGGGMWLGWSGRTTETATNGVSIQQLGDVTYAAMDLTPKRSRAITKAYQTACYGRFAITAPTCWNTRAPTWTATSR